MFNLDKIDLPVLGYRGLEADLTEEEQAIQEMAHRFAVLIDSSPQIVLVS